ncbi:MAG: hypothetical protein Q9227_002615 [Pyrenula ochraceoflavens]
MTPLVSPQRTYSDLKKGPWQSCRQISDPEQPLKGRRVRKPAKKCLSGLSYSLPVSCPTLPLLPSTFDGAGSELERCSSSHTDSEPSQNQEHALNAAQSPPLSDTNEDRGRAQNRRHISADAALRTRSWFASPDRFVTSRPSPLSEERPIHSSRHPNALTPQERYTRSRDQSQDPFSSSTPSRSRDVIRTRPLLSDSRPQPPHITPHFVNNSNIISLQRDNEGHIDVPRQISAGGVWNVGGRGAAQGGPLPSVPDGSGGLLTSGSSAPMVTAHFLDRETAEQDLERHENRIAVALDIDPARRVISPKIRGKSPRRAVPATPFRVLDAPRLRDDFYCSPLAYSATARTLAVGLSSRVYLWSEDGGVQFPPFNNSRSANYVTSLSFSSAEGEKSILAVGRQSGQVSLWSCIDNGIRFEAQQPNAISCLCFKQRVSRRVSQHFAGQQYDCEDLLVGDDAGNVFYYSLEWPTPELHQSHPDWTGTMTLLAKVAAHSQQICGLAWAPNGRYFATGGNDNTALLFEVSRVLGIKKPLKRGRLRRTPSITGQHILARSTVLSPPADEFRGRSPQRGSSDRRSMSPPPPRRLNPNAPEFIYRRIPPPTTIVPTPVGPRPPVGLITPPRTPSPTTTTPAHRFPNLPPTTTLYSTTVFHPNYNTTPTIYHPPRSQAQTFLHTAAVKALAFAPWQPTLLATGGGSNDRQIHFFHTGSGASLATINVHAQVTSLIWSQTRREICATFGYAQPEHGVRIAVFSWPQGDCVVAIPWGDPGTTVDVGRVLWAIPYPGGPNNRSHGGINRSEGEGGTWWSRTEEEGCIIVASSDESVKFHEVWAGGGKGAKDAGFGGTPGLGEFDGILGGSKILEGVAEEIDVEASPCGPGIGLSKGMVIR